MANRIKPFSSDEVTEEKKVNRASEISRKDDKIKTPSLGLMDIDHTIMYYFNNVINPEVVKLFALMSLSTIKSFTI